MRRLLIVVATLGILSIGLLTLARPRVFAQSASAAATPQFGPNAPAAVPPQAAPNGSATAEPLNGSNAGGTRTQAPSSLTSKLLSNPYCYQPDPTVDQCFINARYYQATDNGTTAPFLQYVSVTIGADFNNLKMRARLNPFFENTIYWTYDQAPGGFKVSCGAPNAGGQGNSYGNLYYLKYQPFDTVGNSMGWDQAGIPCPAFAP